MSCYLGIDAGTSGIKAVVMDDHGRQQGAGFGECDVRTPFPNWAEQQPDQWWDACDQAVKQAVNACGSRAREIRAIGFSGQMQGCTLLDGEMKPVAPSIIWLDQRAADIAQDLSQAVSPQEAAEITGGFCLPSHWAPKLVWLQRNRPHLFEKTRMVLFTKDYLRYRMTGEVATEVSDASLTFLLDLPKRNWSDRMFQATGLPREIVPSRMLESQDVAGHLRREVAQAWGLPEGIPVVAGGGDQPVGAVGCGIVSSGMVSTTIGTSGVVFGCCDQPFQDRKRQAIYSLCHSIPGKYSFLGCTLAAGGSFKWVRDTFFSHEKEQCRQTGEDVYDIMTRLASKSPAGSEGLCFLPYLNGESTPYVDADARGVFFGLSYRHDRGAICRAVMEGVTFSLRDTMEILKETNGLIPTEVRAMGGGAKSPLWRQIQADIYQVPVVTMNLEEGPAAGAAILAAVGCGDFSTVEEACDSLLRKTTYTEPDPRRADLYHQYYQTYQSLYRHLKEDFAFQSRLVRQYFHQGD